jgi:predicted DNA-binding protein (MmcQ/YjbR family)
VATPSTTTRAGAALRTFALRYPETHEDFPWGDRALKVKKKVFVFMHYDAAELSLSMKLPASHGAALLLPFTEPTAYGLWKGGWVTARFRRGGRPPLQLLESWIDESYRAVAPRKLVAGLPAADASPAAAPKRTTHRSSARRSRARR